MNPLKQLKWFLHLFLEGYESENKLDALWLGKIDIFIKVWDAILFIYSPPDGNGFRDEVKKRILEDDYLDIQNIIKN